MLLPYCKYMRLEKNVSCQIYTEKRVGQLVCPKKNIKTRHVLVKHRCPRRQRKSYILTPPHPQGHVMSVKCEEPINKLTVQVWLLYHHPNFECCTFVCKRDGITDRRTDNPITRCPRRTFQAEGIKFQIFFIHTNVGWH